MRVLPILVILAMLTAMGFFATWNQQPITVNLNAYIWNGPAWGPVVAAGGGMWAAFILYLLVAGARWRYRYRRLMKTSLEYRAAVQRLQSVNQDLRQELDSVNGSYHQTAGLI